ncbi:hypothetical protein K7432_003926, partial [Basidiobolus ranarum]
MIDLTLGQANPKVEACEKSIHGESVGGQIATYFKHQFALKPVIQQDPRTFSKVRKGLIVAQVGIAGMLGPLASTVYFPALPTITADMNASTTMVNATVSLFIMFMGIAPVFWASISDHYGIRRMLYLSSIAIFIGATIGCSFASNITLVLILRCIQACGSSSLFSLGAGTIADCFAIHERGTAMSLLFLGQYLGPLLGPTIGGFLTSGFGWRATFWFCAIFASIILLVMFFTLPETYREESQWPALPTDTTELNHKPECTVPSEITRVNNATEIIIPESRSNLVSIPPKRMNPVASLGLLRHWFVVVVSIETGISFGAMFTIETVLPELFTNTYGLNSAQTGLTYLGAGFGNIFGSLVGGFFSDFFLRQAEKRRGGSNVPEDRLSLNMWISGYLFLPGGILLFGWS